MIEAPTVARRIRRPSAAIGPAASHRVDPRSLVYVAIHDYASRGLTGMKMSPVAYRGSLPALNDVVAGHVPLMFVDLGPAVGMIHAGKVRAIGVSTKERIAAVPNVPTLAESGVPEFDAASWQMIVAPGRTPSGVGQKLHDELKNILSGPEAKRQITAAGMIPVENQSIAALRDFIRIEIVRWGKVVKQAGLEGSQ